MKRIINKEKSKSYCSLIAGFFLLFFALSSGCGNKFFDPTQVGRFRPVPAVNVILDSLGVAEETPVAWEGGEEPLPIDTVVTNTDYVFMSGDVVRVAIFELLQDGAYFVNDYIVTESGRISMPEVGVVEAVGLTETQLEEEIRKILSPNILKDPSVTTTLVRSQQRAYSILGDGVPFPSRYFIPRYNFRLTDALATAGGPRQFNVSYIYVSRILGENEKTPGTVNPGFGELELKAIGPGTTRPGSLRRKMAAPRAQYQWPKSKVVIASSEMATDSEYNQFQNRFGGLNNRTSGSIYARDISRTNDFSRTRERIDEPVSVEDILKTLSERSHREAVTNEQVDVPDPYRSLRRSVDNQERINERVNLQEALETTVTPSGPKPTNEILGQDKAGNIEWIFQDGKWIPVQVESPKPVEQEQTGHIEWVFQNGRWIPIQVGTQKPTEPVIKIRPEDQLAARPDEKAPVYGFEQEGAKTRLIRIPADKLLAGDPRYNIVIKPGDTIFVPVDIIGECSITGNVNRGGLINITGRPMTLKQAIAAAGGLGPLAWPKRCEIVRRIGRKKEEIVMVDLDKIASGEQPDFFIKPHDLINVGTHATARWRAILRNAFRATYGFGFVYDRNFGDRDFGTHRPIPGWF